MQHFGKDVEEIRPCTSSAGMWDGAATVVNSMKMPRKVKALPYNLAIPLLRCSLSKRWQEPEEIFTHLFLAALFTASTGWKPPKCPLMSQWNKQNVVDPYT